MGLGGFIIEHTQLCIWVLHKKVDLQILRFGRSWCEPVMTYCLKTELLNLETILSTEDVCPCLYIHLC